MPRLVLLLVLVLLLAPLAAAAPPLASLQEPVHSEPPAGAVAAFTPTSDEVARQHYVVIQTGVNYLVRLKLVDEGGRTVWEEPSATNGIRPFPSNLSAGTTYKLVIAGPADVQVTSRALRTVADTQPTNVSDTLDGTHAWLFQSSKGWKVRVEGADAEWRKLAGNSVFGNGTATFDAVPGQPYVLTLRGEPGSTYAIDMEEHEFASQTPATKESPGAPLAIALAMVALAALVRARRRA